MMKCLSLLLLMFLSLNLLSCGGDSNGDVAFSYQADRVITSTRYGREDGVRVEYEPNNLLMAFQAKNNHPEYTLYIIDIEMTASYVDENGGYVTQDVDIRIKYDENNDTFYLLRLEAGANAADIFDGPFIVSGLSQSAIGNVYDIEVKFVGYFGDPSQESLIGDEDKAVQNFEGYLNFSVE